MLHHFHPALRDRRDEDAFFTPKHLLRSPDHEPGDDPHFSEHHEMTAIYYLNDLGQASLQPMQRFSRVAAQMARNPYLPISKTALMRVIAAKAEMNERLIHTYRKPRFNISCVANDAGHIFDITEEVIDSKPFCDLVHFKRDLSIINDDDHKEAHKKAPKVLIVAPYSGHFSTLLRDTVKTMLRDHDVYVTDWRNARDVPIYRGEFTLESYLDNLESFVQKIGDDVHLLAVCQPAVPVLALVGYLEQAQIPHKIKSMILMGGPIDTRVNPTYVNKIAKDKTLDWFAKRIVSYVPHYYKGAMRRVIPGFVMLSGFMSLNLSTHVSAPHKLFERLVAGDDDGAEKHREFYNEYRSVLDLPADYYLDSVLHAFQEHSLPRGRFCYKGDEIDLSRIRRVALMTVEGQNDDISGVGQTRAAHDLCRGLKDYQRAHHLQPKVGHYGVFNGRRWRSEIMPNIRTFIRQQS